MIKQKEVRVDLDLPMKKKKLVNFYIPVYEPFNLKWYERDGLLTYIDQLKYIEFIENPAEDFRTVKVINVDIIHKECKGQPITDDLKKKYNTIDFNDFVKYDIESKDKAVGSAILCKRKDVLVSRDLVFQHF